MKFIKKLLLLAAIMTLMTGFSAVSAPAADSASWLVYGEQNSLLKASQTKIFDKGVKALNSKTHSYQPVMMLSKQKKSGTTTYAFLSLRLPRNGGSISWVVVLVKRDAKGSCSVASVNAIDIDDIKTLSASKKSSGWTYNTSSYKKRTVQPAVARKAFKKAAKKYSSVKLKLLTFFGKKQQNGYYYKGLCIGTKGGVKNFYVVSVYKNKKNYKIVSCKPLNLGAYLTAPAASSTSTASVAKASTSTSTSSGSSSTVAAATTKTTEIARTLLSALTVTETAVPFSDVTTAFTMSTSESALRDKLVKAALSYVGKLPYVYGGNSLTTGTDCSGFIYWLYKKYAGITTERSSADFLNLRNISYKDLLPGDVVVYEHHVALYIGKDKDGKDRIVHAKGAAYGTVEDTMWYKSPLGYARIIK